MSVSEPLVRRATAHFTDFFEAAAFDPLREHTQWMLIGGAVRDHLLGREADSSADLDIAVLGNAKNLQSLERAFRIAGAQIVRNSYGGLRVTISRGTELDIWPWDAPSGGLSNVLDRVDFGLNAVGYHHATRELVIHPRWWADIDRNVVEVLCPVFVDRALTAVRGVGLASRLRDVLPSLSLGQVLRDVVDWLADDAPVPERARAIEYVSEKVVAGRWGEEVWELLKGLRGGTSQPVLPREPPPEARGRGCQSVSVGGTGSRYGMAKKISQNKLIGQAGVNLIERIVLEMGFAWYPTGDIEAGTDGIIELRNPETEEALNTIVLVQSRATSKAFKGETDTEFRYYASHADLQYWRRANVPTILIVSRPHTNEAYWVAVQEYFRDRDSRSERRIVFNKDIDRFDATAAAKLTRLAVARTPGLHLPAAAHSETLYTNLLEVDRFPDVMWVAATKYTRPKTMWGALGTVIERPRCEWFLKEGNIYSIHDLTERPWSEVCDVGSAEQFDMTEWADSEDPDRQRDFVRLLSLCVRGQYDDDLRYFRDKNYLFFRPNEDLEPKRVSGARKGRGRTVFRAYASKRDPEKIAFCRHAALAFRPVRFAGKWFLELNPTYHFTWDGHRLDKFGEERLAKIKRLERNDAVLGQVKMWARYLAKSRSLFDTKAESIEFGDLITVEAPRGLADKAWRLQAAEDQDHGGVF